MTRGENGQTKVLWWFSAKWRVGAPVSEYNAIFGGPVCTANAVTARRKGPRAETATGDQIGWSPFTTGRGGAGG